MRIRLELGIQRNIIDRLVRKYHTLNSVATIYEVNYSTFKNYYSGERLLPEYLYLKIIEELDLEDEGVRIPENWGASKGGKKGIKAMFRKHSQKLQEWRRKGGRNSPISVTKNIIIPNLSVQLAEFIGIHLGDGTLTKNFIRISGDKRYDMLYMKYIQKLGKSLFGLQSTISFHKNRNTCYVTFQSVALSQFLSKNYGILPGDKIRNRIGIPSCILRNKQLSIACLRGLIDTDGCVSRRGIGGKQFTVCFTSHSKVLIEQVKEIGYKYNIFSHAYKTEVGTNDRQKVRRYFQVVGSSNIRHIVRFCERFFNNNTIYRDDVIVYYKKPFYRGLKLPYIIDMDS
jgi:hypothetical protein